MQWILIYLARNKEMILLWITLISITQLVLDLIAIRLKLKYTPVIILLVILVAYVFILPSYFYPETDVDGGNCGMPILAINLLFWVLGGGIAIAIHLILSFLKRAEHLYSKKQL